MSDELLDRPVRQFLDELASGAPTPGGGSVAALTGALAAGLLTMVCDLTIGKKAYAAFEDQARAIDSGFTLHLGKPVEPAQLLASVAELAGRPAR